MKEPLSTEDVLEMGQMCALFAVVPPEDVFSHYKAKDVFSHYKPEEAAYQPEELLSALPIEIVRTYLQKRYAHPDSEQN